MCCEYGSIFAHRHPISFTLFVSVNLCVFLLNMFSIICFAELWCEILGSFKLKRGETKRERKNNCLCQCRTQQKKNQNVLLVQLLFVLIISHFVRDEHTKKNVNISKESEKKRPKAFSRETRNTNWRGRKKTNLFRFQ